MTRKINDFSGVTGRGKINDVLYNEYATGPQGARFTLFREKHHTPEMINKAKTWLKVNQDVVKIYVEPY